MKYTVDLEQVDLLEAQHQKVQDEIVQLPANKLAIVRQVQRDADLAFEDVNEIYFNFDHEDRIRAAGYTISEAQDVANLSQKAGVGRIFSYEGEALILTPFKTVVDAQVYVDAIQNRLLETTTVPVEVEIIQLKKQIEQFTSLSVVGLIKLTFKKLFK